MISYTPQKDTKTAYIASILLILPGVLALMLASFAPSPVILQLIGVGCCSAGLYIMYRYALIHYVYTIDEDGLFTVNRVSGNRSNAVARIPLSHCSMLVRADDSALDGERFPGGRYSYHVRMRSENRYTLVSGSGNDRLKLTIECSKELSRAIALRLPPDAVVRT